MKWDLWNEKQEKLFQNIRQPKGYVGLEESKKAPLYTFFPTLLKGAGTTILISVISMALAVTLGLILTIVRLYSRPPLSSMATGVYRALPGHAASDTAFYPLLRPPEYRHIPEPSDCRISGLGMNYAAYEAELYRAGISAVPKGQMEAALSLGMTRGIALRRVILPQAFKIALPGVTNDFIALFKDSSLVSVIAMVELTKTYSILGGLDPEVFRTRHYRALLYFGMSYPLSLFARSLENRLKRSKQ